MAANHYTLEERRNATPSWSGYLHQGQVGLIVALDMLSLRLVEDPELTSINTFKLAYEYHEDFSILNGEDDIVSMHQVKARVGAGNNKMSTYRTAIKDFDGVTAPEDSRFMHTVAEVTDWSMDASQNPNHVNLYTYGDSRKFCDLNGDTLRNQATARIRQLRVGATSNIEADVIYSHLLSLLIDKVKECHQRNDRSHPTLIFAELISCARSSIVEDIKSESEMLKLRQLMLHILFQTESDLDQAGLSTGSQWNQAIDVIEALCKLDDKELLDALAKLHPDESDFYDMRNLKTDGFKNVFIEIIREAAGFELTQNGYLKNGEAYLLTNISETPTFAAGVASRILENPNNSKLFYEGKNIVTEKLEGSFKEFVGAKIESETASRSDDILKPESMNFMKVDNALNKLNLEEV
jgi:hypothetical protein